MSESNYRHLPRAAYGPLECPYEGEELLHNAHYNKGSAFTSNERAEFKLHGLLPPNIQTLGEQVERAYQQYRSRPDNLAKNTFLASLKVQNEVLYYKLLQTHLKEMFGVIYTPTEAEAIQTYSRLFRRPEGCFLNISDVDKIDESLDNFMGNEIDYIVVSDGEQILGIGDQGVGAILISVAKLAITTISAGIHPSRQLAVVLDCGTDNEKLLNDKLYLGVRQARVRGERYDQFVGKFIQAARERFPRAYIHFEDFGLHNAKRILEKYRTQIPCFNDDIQGTGCVTLAAVLTALQLSGVSLQDVRVVCFGAGSAGTGIAQHISNAIVAEARKTEDDARKQIWCIDKSGLLLKSLGDELTPAQAPFAREEDEWHEGQNTDLLGVVKKVKPHVLIGTSTKPGSFTEDVIREMAKHVERPAIFPLSNPTSLQEGRPQDICDWTDGKALIATGGPCAPVKTNRAEIEIAECNNSTAFPGIGLGAILSRARRVSDKMLIAASRALAAQSPALKDEKRPLLSDIEDVRELSVEVAEAVVRAAITEGLAENQDIPVGEEDLKGWIRAQMWEPEYRALKKPTAGKP